MAKMTRTKARRKKHLRVRSKISGTATIPRINVYKSHKNIEVQLIDDVNRKTLAHSSSISMKLPYGGNIESATKVGENFGTKVAALKLEKVVFDRGGYIYHGRVKALAEAIKEKGVKF
ncbi:MAG: 50S ribosomal protein L18 [Mycoplasmatales bacterium]|nr:50S ribosomal protein L18 [Mycoplasmatales bacterium]